MARKIPRKNFHLNKITVMESTYSKYSDQLRHANLVKSDKATKQLKLLSKPGNIYATECVCLLRCKNAKNFPQLHLRHARNAQFGVLIKRKIFPCKEYQAACDGDLSK